MSFSEESDSEQEMEQEQPQLSSLKSNLNPQKYYSQRNHYCKFCDKDLSHRHMKTIDFEKHLEKCRKYFKYAINGSTCKFCQKSNDKLGQLLHHIEKIHYKEIEIETENIQQNLETAENTREREDSVAVKPHTCDGCMKTFKYNMGLKKHKIICQKIEKSNINADSKNSNLEEGEIKGNHLPDADVNSGSEKEFSVKSKSKKTNIKMRNCEYCNLEKSAAYYREHVKKCVIYSTLVPNNICQICNKSFGLPITNSNQKNAYSHLSKRHRSLINQKDNDNEIVNKQLNNPERKQIKPEKQIAGTGNQNPPKQQPKHKCVYCNDFVSSEIYSEHMKSCIEKSNSKPPPIVKKEKIPEENSHDEDNNITEEIDDKIPEVEPMLIVPDAGNPKDLEQADHDDDDEDPNEILGDILDDSSIGTNDTHGPIEIDDIADEDFPQPNANSTSNEIDDNECKIVVDPRKSNSSEVEILNSPNPYTMPMLITNNKSAAAKQFRTFMQNKDPRMISQLYNCPICKGKFFTFEIVQDHLSQFHKIPKEHQQRLKLEINCVTI